MDHDDHHEPEILIVPCSGIGKVHGLVSREATFHALDQLPDLADTVCLALLVSGDRETVEKVQALPSITVDGCPKLCAHKNVELAGGRVAQGVRVYDTMKRHRGANFGTVTCLTEQGLAVADEIGDLIAESAREAMGPQETEAHHG